MLLQFTTGYYRLLRVIAVTTVTTVPAVTDVTIATFSYFSDLIFFALVNCHIIMKMSPNRI